ncbi:hypothetical protein [Candidatus Phytoplasma meliae]|uniref:Effector n=1 Tax=Candidatus Phytoplasma meliae TaxID=1848402 RepID=A0ABS5CXL9_9MOLU|nr:hypothetical protein [Candidatus Phytoplasma meliae]MBP5835710.1 hypothetical protein [Candidatus Phytoplasma meliae]
MKKKILYITLSILNLIFLIILATFTFINKANLKQLTQKQKELSSKPTTTKTIKEEPKYLETLEKNLNLLFDSKEFSPTAQGSYQQIKNQIQAIKDIQQKNQQDEATTKIFTDSINFFEQEAQKANTNESRNDFTNLASMMKGFKKACDARDILKERLETQRAYENSQNPLSSNDLDFLEKYRTYLNAYATLIDLHTNKIEQIDELRKQAKSNEEKGSLQKLKSMITTNLSTKLIKYINEGRSHPSFRQLTSIIRQG